MSKELPDILGGNTKKSEKKVPDIFSDVTSSSSRSTKNASIDFSSFDRREDMVPVSFRLNKDQKKRLEAYAERRGLKLAQYVRSLVIIEMEKLDLL